MPTSAPPSSDLEALGHLEETVGETCALAAAQAEQISECHPDVGDPAKARRSPLRAAAEAAGTPAVGGFPPA